MFFSLKNIDGELYCQICFKKTFPNSEMPLIYSDTSLIKPEGGEGGCPRCDGAVFQVSKMEKRSEFLN
jgi:hypothetical protein